GLATCRQAGEGSVPADAAVVGHPPRGRIDVINDGLLSPAAEQKTQQRNQHTWLDRHKTLLTQQILKIATQYFSYHPIVKTLEIFEPRAMQHQQNRNDFADRQAGLRPARCSFATEQVGLLLCFESLTKIVYFAEHLGEPVQRSRLPWVY